MLNFVSALFHSIFQPHAIQYNFSSAGSVQEFVARYKKLKHKDTKHSPITRNAT
jgi:hypothetical protein